MDGETENRIHHDGMSFPFHFVLFSSQSSNGTYVNDKHLKIKSEICVLQHNDLIGLGCDESVFTVEMEEKDKANYYVFKLQDLTLIKNDDDVIDLVSDDEQEETDVKPVIVNGKVQRERAVVEEPAPAVVIPTANVPSNPVSNHDDHEDNELIYSQQILMNIKQEVNCPDQNQIENFENDFSIVIDSDDPEEDLENEAEDDSEDDSSWSNRLSQNQDLVIKKVSESTQNKKRKITKQIEAIPLSAAKKARRNSVSAIQSVSVIKQRRNSVSASVYAKPMASDLMPKSSAANTSAASTSKVLGENGKQGPFVDRLDPFVAKKKPVEKQKSFEDALKQTLFKPKKPRVAHVPKIQQIGDIKSIVRRSDAYRSPTDAAKPKKRVRFSTDVPLVREYTPDRGDIGEIVQTPVNRNRFRPHDTDGLNSFENDPLHNIITDITEWKPEWLTQRDITPPINGVNFIVTPLAYKYASFDVYKEYVILFILDPISFSRIFNQIKSTRYICLQKCNVSTQT